MRCLLTAFLFIAHIASAAVGDITGAEVESSGAVLKLWVSGLNTNGNVISGFSGTNNPANAKIKLSVTSLGFSDAGTETLAGRTTYGTHVLRAPYPMENTNQIYPNGDGSIVRLWLSDYVASSDSNLTLTALSGAYAVTNGTGTNSVAITGLSVTNSSTNTYSYVIGHWNDYGFQQADGATHRVRASAYHWSAREGRPVRGIEFRATDGTTTVTQLVSRPTIDKTAGDAVPVVEYLWDIPLSSLASSNQIKVDFRAFPWIGRTNEVLDTSDGLYSAPSSGHTSLWFWNNTGGQMKRTAAKVDPINGSDATGIATNYAGWTTNWPPFRTIRGAAAAISATNNVLYGRQNVGGGMIFLEEGDHTWPGTNTSIGGRGSNFVTITKITHAARDNVVITTNYGSTSGQNLDCGDYVKLTDITFGKSGIGGSGSIVINNVDHLIVDDCTLNTMQGAMFYNNTNWYVVRSYVRQSRQGLKRYSGAPSDPVLVRGNQVELTNTCEVVSGNILGNSRVLNSGFTVQWKNAVTTDAPKPSSIFAFNKIVQTNTTSSSSQFTRETYDASFRGVAIVQNVFEAVSNQTGEDDLFSGSTNINNVIFWNNVWLSKVNAFYNADVSQANAQTLAWMHGNIWGDWNIKSDTFTTGDGVRIGNWSIDHAVGFYANAFPEFYSIGASGAFNVEYAGVGGWASPITSTTNAWARFTDYRAYVDAPATGGGNYRPLSDSPLFGFGQGRWVLPFDIEGQPRSAIDPPGAYSAGNVRKGAFF